MGRSEAGQGSPRDPQPKSVAVATANRIDYARLYADAGDLEKAAVQLDRLQTALSRPADRAEYAEVQGYTDLLLGSPRDALAHLEIAHEGHRQSYGAEHPSTAAVLQLQGDAYRLAGDFPAAITAYRETLRLRRRAFGFDFHPGSIDAANAVDCEFLDLDGLKILRRSDSGEIQLGAPPGGLNRGLRLPIGGLLRPFGAWWVSRWGQEIHERS